MKNKISNLIQFKTFDKKFGLACIGVGMMTCVCSHLVSNSLVSNLNSIGLHPKAPNFPFDNNIVPIILYIISMSIIAPLVEEFACRGVILGSLRQYGDGFAILISAAIFGIIHGNFFQFPAAFITGLILGFLTVRLNSILPAIIIHFINNFSVSIFIIIEANLGSYYSTLIENLFYLLLLLIGTFCLIYILKKDKSFFSIQRPTSPLNLKKKIKSFASGVIMIISLIPFILLFMK